MKTKYFRTFSGIRQPVTPIDELDFADAQKLTTYYEAKYSDHDQLVEFRKHLIQRSDGQDMWTVSFVESYEYWPNRALKRRSRSSAGQTSENWEFGEKRFRRTGYWEEFVSRWFGGKEQSSDKGLVRDALAFHEAITELESNFFGFGMGEFPAHKDLLEAMLRFKAQYCEIIEQLAGERPKLCVAGDDEGGLLEGFDPPPLSLYGICHEHRQSHQHQDVRCYIPAREFSEESRYWAKQSNVGAIAVVPISNRIEDQENDAFNVFLLFESALDDQQIAVLNSLNRRLKLTFQKVISQPTESTLNRRQADNSD